MDNKNVIIIILAVVLVMIAVGCLYFVSMPTAGDNNHVNETNITNNATNVSQEDNSMSSSSDNSGKSYGSQKEYDDWQEDYELVSMMNTEIQFIEVYFQLQEANIILEYMKHIGLQVDQFLKKE